MRAGGLPPATPGSTHGDGGTPNWAFNEGRGVTPGDAAVLHNITRSLDDVQ